MPLDAWLNVLPERLAERVRPIGDRRAVGNGEFVLYWMHHAVRDHDNPALDVAVALANERGLPVLVYQGLGGRHPYNSDRHHSFILQGAAETHRGLAVRGIRAVFHLDRGDAGPSPLPALAARAALLISEDFPAPPFPAWTARIAARVACPTLAVDASCIVPMATLHKSFSRAYAFRDATRAAFARRVPLAWPDVDPLQPAWSGDCGFDACDLEGADIAALCAACDIDHGIPPVAHTRGGAGAGYARWNAFRADGLARYARHRNDAARAWSGGVSRLSPYLHHGHVSPFRIAREAAAFGGDGADKFLDELLVWRELAFNFCFHTADPESLDALPEWARATLAEHAADARGRLIDDETLARSRSGDALWDLAQTSLRIHGELHNNLRMTWAKAIPQWRPDPQSALRTLIDLNHRYALDGSDPNSYGGLLWTLGLFDRPFDERPVTGTLRARDPAAHARRVDMPRLAERLRRPVCGTAQRIAVIGAGVAGLTAARQLHDHGHHVTVFEKSRGLGGRAATRRDGQLGFDHGAQYFTADREPLRRAVTSWVEAGVVAAWQPRIGRVDAHGITASPDRRTRWVATPGMSALGGHLGRDLDVRRRTRVAVPVYRHGQWWLHDDGGNALGRYDALVVAAPAPQAAELLSAAAPALAAQAASVRYAPTWALMLDFASPPALDYDALFFDGDDIRWAAANGSKPGRHGATWVVHAAPPWTRRHVDDAADDVATDLAQTFADLTGLSGHSTTTRCAHRWLYSLVDNPLQVGALWDAAQRVAVCGDWCQGARIEGAFDSGIAAAGFVLRDLAAGSATSSAQPADDGAAARAAQRERLRQSGSGR